MASLSLTLGNGTVMCNSSSGDSGVGEGCCGKCYGENPGSMGKRTGTGCRHPCVLFQEGGQGIRGPDNSERIWVS